MQRPVTLPSRNIGPASARLRGKGIVATLNAWHARWRARRSLNRMPDHLLRDIGLSRDEARRETVKPFWRD
jgi:uncharacterized protein YjiS (DUF1127 family)